MRKGILAATISAVLVVAVFSPLMLNDNARAQIASESRVMSTMLSLTNIAKGQIIDINAKNNDIINDLALKKKFYEFPPKKVIIILDQPVLRPGWNVTNAEAVGIRVVDCLFPGVETEQSACAFNVESIQFDNRAEVGFSGENILISSIVIDGVETDVSEKLITTPTNLIVDLGMKIGASEEVLVVFDQPYTGPVEFNGEKPQGMLLCTTAFSDFDLGVEQAVGQNPCVSAQ